MKFGYARLLALVLGVLLSMAPSLGQTTDDPSSDASAETLWHLDTGG